MDLQMSEYLKELSEIAVSASNPCRWTFQIAVQEHIPSYYPEYTATPRDAMVTAERAGQPSIASGAYKSHAFRSGSTWASLRVTYVGREEIMWVVNSMPIN